MKEFYFSTKTQKKNFHDSDLVPEANKEEVIAVDKKYISIIAHDIKTPLGSVIGFLDLIKGDIYKWDREKILENIEIALNAAKSTFSLLNSLLEWANADNIYKSFQPVVLDLKSIINEEVSKIEIVSVQKKITIRSFVSPDEKVFADENMVKSILRNLLANAIKYSYKYGEIDIKTKRIRGFLEITIKDYGVGIDAETVNTIFSTDNYISTLGTESEPGTGFGLLLCKELVEINNGKIRIVGNADMGSEFKFTLPLSPKR